LEENLTKLFENLTKIAMTHRSRILDKLALEVAAPMIEETIEKGKEKAKERIRQEGMEKGKYAQAIKTAENCLKEGMSKELVAKITELPLKTVQELAKKLKNKFLYFPS
jgi:predicted transposase YdaD